MNNSNPNHNSKNHNPKTREGYRREIVGYRLVAMSADQVDEIARAEGRGENPNVADRRLRCRWCFLKGGIEGQHFCRWRTERNKDSPPAGGPVRQVPIYRWVKI